MVRVAEFMSAYDSIIYDLASDLAFGDRSEHLVCPSCNGGASNERSLLIWCQPEGITYKCYRVSCGLGGKVGSAGYRPTKQRTNQPKKHVKELRPEPIPDDVLGVMLDKFWWASEEILKLNGVMWDEHKERLLYPIKAMTGHNEGYLARKYPELILREKNHYGSKAMCHYYTVPEGYKLTCLMPTHGCRFEDYIVIVEDMPSAIRMNEYVPCCALSGTSIMDAALMDIVRAGKKNILLILDEDATAKAAKLAYNYSLYFSSFTFMPLLGEDIKDLPDGDMLQLVDAVYKRLGI